MALARDIALVLLAALAGGAAARRLGVPAVVGYMAAGVVVGPYTGGPTVAGVAEMERLADVGVALLLFTLGLDLPLERLAEMRRLALLGTPVQLLLTMALGYGAGRVLGWDGAASLWLGAALSLSSTMVVVRTLGDLGLRESVSGRVMVGMLLVQDLAVVPLSLLLPAAGAGQGAWVRLAAAAAAVFALYAAGSWAVPRLFRRVAAWQVRELFILSSVALGLGVAYATYAAGLSFALGAFLAGVALSRSPYGHQALHDLIPLREVFAAVFFVSVGMLLDPGTLLRAPGAVAALAAVALLGKGLVVAGVVRAWGHAGAVSLAAGLGLFQLGEFSFMLARLGRTAGALPPEAYAVLLATVAVSMAATPVALRLYARRPRRAPPAPGGPEGAAEYRRHAIVAGYGRAGRFLAAVLGRLGLPVVVVDLDPERVEEARRAGHAAVFGDVAAPPVLAAAGAAAARIMVVAVSDPAAVRVACQRVRQLNPGVHLVARANTEAEMAELAALGVPAVVEPEFEAALEMAHQVMAHLGIAGVEILRFSDAVRRERYAPLLGGPAGDPALAALRDLWRAVETEWVRLEEGSPLVGRSIGECQVRARTGASVVAVVRGEALLPNPGPRLILRAGDALAVMGSGEERAAFRRWAAGAGPPGC